ncbi:prenyltransferase/squalene oxidase repeat-containing protein [Streptomyces canus]|uniref:prenyltransferase/squalene oxidase repeat-containing protein n=1 Tax=Streptomyces canus TaxID=58343 RepID=UPI002E2C6497|nr:prenyltransferase/squalene oxidase repeat-containing protein [Streptomyces canus]
MQRVDVALDRAVAYLINHQSSDGAWRDYQLEPGVSDSWTTGYVGLALADLRGTSTALAAATNFLQSSMRPDGGWAYNDLCPVDCDSTSNVVLFLDRLGAGVPARTYERIARFQNADGGFATFAAHWAGDSWGCSHPDVNPLALRALSRGTGTDDVVESGVRYALAAREESGLWNSFWWTTPLYSTAANVTTLLGLGRLVDAPCTVGAVAELARLSTDPFRLALGLDVMALLGGDGSETCRRLLALQRPDGSWHAQHRNLRVTVNWCCTPWQDDGFVGHVATDQHHLVTSATVLRSLVTFRSATSGGQPPSGPRRSAGNGQQFSGHDRAGSSDSQP